MGKILLFYKYVDITYPGQIKKWQRKLCDELGLKGRILLAQEGINGTIGGTNEACQAYIEAMEAHELFAGIDFKESAGGADHFPRMRIVIKDEICHLGLDTKKYSAKDGGTHLKPTEVHELIKNKKGLVILDGRNYFEAKIGTFENAITPKIEYFREFPEWVDENAEQFKDKEVLMFCTGGIRCERATSYLKSKNIAKEIYQIEGGIHRYIEQFPEGYFRGKNYVFDARVAVKANDDIIGSCDVCNIKCDDYTNCVNAECNLQYIACPKCLDELENCCSKECLGLVIENKVVVRVIPKKFEAQEKEEPTHVEPHQK